MKSIYLFCFVLIAIFNIASSRPLENLEEKWQKFKVDFNKSYATPDEENRRKELFRVNAEQIEAHNARHAQGLETYTQGINHFADLTPEERSQYLGFRPHNQQK